MNKPDAIRFMHKLVFTSIRSYCYEGGTADIRMQRTLRFYAIALISSGKGTVTINGTSTPAMKGDLFFLQPDMLIEASSNCNHPLQYSLVLFSAVQLHKQNNAWLVKQPEFPFKGKLTASQSSETMMEWIHPLISKGALHSSDKQAKTALLTSLLHAVARAESTTQEEEQQKIRGIEQTLAFINENYSKEIKIEQLAQMSGFSLNHFTRVFKQQMKITPSEYIFKQRMARAKQLLTSSKKAKEVAEQVGYKDEHYFSRAFKKAEGVPPTLYIKNKCHRIAALYYGLDDHLVTLGLRPVASLSYAERVTYSYPLPAVSEQSEHGLKLDSRKSNYDALLRSKPDLIMTSDRLVQDGALNQIAPTAVLAHSNQYGRMLEHMGKILGREQQAALWVDQYGERMEEIRNRLKACWGRQTAYFIRVSPNFYRVYGANNQTGSLLYDDIGLSLPVDFPDREWAVDIQLEDLLMYRAEHLFLMADPTSEAKERLQQLLQSEQWASLEAVQQRRVYDASDLFFKTLGPTGRMWAMNQVAAQLGI